VNYTLQPKGGLTPVSSSDDNIRDSNNQTDDIYIYLLATIKQ